MKSILRDKKGRFIKGSHVKTEYKKGITPWNKNKTGVYSEETKRRISESLTGENSPLFGICLTKKHKKNIGEANKGNIPWNKGKHLSEETKLSIGRGNKGKKRSKEMILNYSILRRGKNNWNWKGGLSSLIKNIRNNFKYRQWRSDIFTRDNFICQKCGEIGGRLNAHHIKNFPSILQYYEITTLEEALNCEELWNINNGVTLCKECHIRIHRKGVKI